MALTIFLSVFMTISVILVLVLTYLMYRVAKFFEKVDVNLKESTNIINAFYEQQERAMEYSEGGCEGKPEEAPEKKPMGL
ncbi:MAG: hypothetical protein ACTSRU_19465 [Candidatus Hodarchaeales archaeon]